MRVLLCHLLLLSSPFLLVAQSNLTLSPEFEQAVAHQTRTLTGEPGPNYFQNYADYIIEARLFPKEKRLSGKARITYHNQSGQELDQMVVRLYQDMYKKGFPSDDQISRTDRTDGVELSLIVLDGDTLTQNGQSSKIRRKGTNLFLDLSSPLASGKSISLEIDWAFHVPEKTRVRMGTYIKNAFFIAYWYPQVAVFDDIHGWDELDYTGTQEFYQDFGDFDVSLTIPDDYQIWATGNWTNPASILEKDFLERYQTGLLADTVVQLVSEADRKSGKLINQPTESGLHTWRFQAEDVPDFAFGAADYYLWDITSTQLGQPEGPRVKVEAAYNPKAKDFKEVAAFSQEILEDLSTELPGVPYPYPKITIWNGEKTGGGMEYPMMVNDASTFSRAFTFSLTYHEIAHTYFPFYMGINERRYAWMDEGWASFFPEDLMLKKGFSRQPMRMNILGYVGFAGAKGEKALMTNSMDLQGRAYGVASYSKPATAYYLLRELLGPEMFKEALQTYMERWKGKHPLPYDFFHTFNEVADQDLSWFWKPWFFETGYPDLKMEVNKIKGKQARLTIIKEGSLPVPIYLTFTLKDGTKEVVTYKADVWADGKTTYPVVQKFSSPVTAVKLGAPFVPDVNSAGDRFEK
ncbi:MAG: M1 family metallopeptidase [Bacteroidota bacterium]